MISFIICSHKAPATIFDCLESICRQDATIAWEMVIVNNGFPDEIERYIAALSDQRGMGDRLRMVKEPTPGQGFDRKRGELTFTT